MSASSKLSLHARRTLPRARVGGYGARVGGRVTRGALEHASAAPGRGERTVELAATGAFVVEQILSGRLAGPADYLQDHDEWVVVLAGRARLLVGGVEVALAAGEWLLLPAGRPHTLLETEPGTSWIAVHGRP
jgi:cupin 2 domain-containing protein